MVTIDTFFDYHSILDCACSLPPLPSFYLGNCFFFAPRPKEETDEVRKKKRKEKEKHTGKKEEKGT